MSPRHAAWILILALVAAGPALPQANTRWVATWSAAPDSPGAALQPQTIRQVVRTSIGGSALRIRLSNLFGTAPVAIGSVHMAKHADGPSIISGTDRVVTFGGNASVTIPQGADVLSDPIALPAAALEELVVSVYLPEGAQAATIHTTGFQTAFITGGDATAAATFTPEGTAKRRFFLTDVEVAANAEARALVVMGDSITDGVGSTTDRNTRWPDLLAQRLQADPTRSSVAVVNAGISGNRILNDAVPPFLGHSALARLDRDVLNKPGVRWVLLLHGINDITGASILKTPQDSVSAGQIIGGMKTLIARAHARGVKIFGATLLPLAGTQKPFQYSAEVEASRREVNAWIRTSGAFDAVIDLDQALRDPAHPDALRPEYDSGDHLHPNEAGYEAMAKAIDLRLLDETSPADLIKARGEHYRKLGESFKTIRDQTRSARPDFALIQGAAMFVGDAAEQQSRWFPAGTGPRAGVKTRAKPEIWTLPMKFEAAKKLFAAAAPKLLTAVRSRNVADVRREFAEVGKTCGNCHDTFRGPE